MAWVCSDIVRQSTCWLDIPKSPTFFNKRFCANTKKPKKPNSCHHILFFQSWSLFSQQQQTPVNDKTPLFRERSASFLGGACNNILDILVLFPADNSSIVVLVLTTIGLIWRFPPSLSPRSPPPPPPQIGGQKAHHLIFWHILRFAGERTTNERHKPTQKDFVAHSLIECRPTWTFFCSACIQAAVQWHILSSNKKKPQRRRKTT